MFGGFTSFQLLGFAALSGIAISSWISNGGLGGGLGKGGVKTGIPITLNRYDSCLRIRSVLISYRSAVYLLLFIAAAAVLLSSIYLMLTRTFTRLIMHITLILSILLNMYAFFFVSSQLDAQL